MSKPPRIDRKTLKNPDEFVSKGRATLEYLVKQRTRFIPVLVVAAVVIAAVYAYDWWNTGRLEKGWASYQEITKVAEAERWEKLKAFHQDQGSGRPALFAAVNLGDHYFDEAKKEALKDPAIVPSAVPAAEWYAKALGEGSLVSGERQLLHLNRGGALEMQKQWDAALKEYQTSADLAGEGKPLALLGLARVHEAMNATDKAIQTYEKVAADFLNTEYAKLAKNSMRRLKSPLFGAPNS